MCGLYLLGYAGLLAQHGRNVLRHERRSLGKLRRLQRLLRHHGDAVEDGDGFHLWRFNVQRVEQQHGDAGVYAGGSWSPDVLGAELRAVERVQRRRCLWAGGDTVEDRDELQLQLRKWRVRGEQCHRDAGVSWPFKSLLGGV